MSLRQVQAVVEPLVELRRAASAQHQRVREIEVLVRSGGGAGGAGVVGAAGEQGLQQVARGVWALQSRMEAEQRGAQDDLADVQRRLKTVQRHHADLEHAVASMSMVSLHRVLPIG